MKYWYSITFKNGAESDFTSYQLVQFDINKPLFKLNYISKKWKDKINTISIVTSEVLFVEHGELREVGND